MYLHKKQLCDDLRWLDWVVMQSSFTYIFLDDQMSWALGWTTHCGTHAACAAAASECDGKSVTFIFLSLRSMGNPRASCEQNLFNRYFRISTDKLRSRCVSSI